MTKYCLGLVFDNTGHMVLLIKKNRPEWQCGKLNGIGGHVEDGEEPIAAMVREMREETGIETNAEEWKALGTMLFVEAEVYIYTIFTEKIWEFTSLTDEKVRIYNVATFSDNPHISNIPWLIALAIDNRFGGNNGRDIIIEATYV